MIFMVKRKKAKQKVGAVKTRTEIRVERFIIDELDRYIKLHKEHEKDLTYIG